MNIYLGEYKKAKSIYKQIELQSPNLYSTSSNLGTIYELIGQPDSALVWIQKSININPDSHDGSEWVHLKILEFKISNSNDYRQSILGLDFGSEGLPQNNNAYDLNVLLNHVKHQLRERTVFVKPKNKIVGNIYFDYGNMMALERDVETALESYKAAKEYGYSSELMDKRIKAMTLLILEATPSLFLGDVKDFLKKHFTFFLYFILGVFLLSMYLISRFMYRKIKNTRL